MASNWTKWYMSINFVPVLLAILPVFYEDTFFSKWTLYAIGACLSGGGGGGGGGE